MDGAGSKKILDFMAKEGIPKEFILDYSSLTVGKALGEGGYGTVYSGTYKKGADVILVAIKKLNTTCSTLSDRQFAELASEIGYIQKKSTKFHASLVHFHGVSISADRIHLVAELCVAGNLHDRLHNNSCDITWRMRRKFAIELARGVEYLHSKPVVIHRDLKPLNVVLDEDWNAKICDFGLSLTMTMSQTHVTITNPAGTPIYMAPECFNEGKISDRTDIWALGCMIIELFGGGPPFDGCSLYTIIKNLADNQVSE
eukprot:GHVU01004427.1.p1 GENE.GHVU01004427.1~~GHVU01004427.1.p1  ORF type:complete len:257 (-),score=56.18 GHVU01004427.1:218-988(-)